MMGKIVKVTSMASSLFKSAHFLFQKMTKINKIAKILKVVNFK